MRYWLLAAIVGLGLVLGCSKPPEEPASGTPGRGEQAQPAPDGTATPATPAGPQKRIGMSQCNRGEPWRVQMDTDVTDAVAKHADQLEVKLQDAQNDVKIQQSQVRDFVAQRYDLIIISPKEARPLAAPVSEAIKAGIPVIVLDRDIDGGDYTCFIGADNVKIGRELGKHMVQVLGGRGNVVELKGLQTSTPGHDRHNGFMEGIKGSGLKIIYDSDCRWLEDKAKADMQSVLTRFPDIDAVYGHNDPSAHGAYMAAKQEGKGREKSIRFFGIDALPHEGVRYVQEGILTATFQYPTGGQEAIDLALKILAGEQVQKKMVLGTRLFTAQNVDKGGEAVE